MYSAKTREKQLAQQHLSSLVNANRAFENNQSDMSRIEANSVGRSACRARTLQMEEVAAETQRRETEAKEMERRAESERQQKLADELYELNRRRIVEAKMRQQIRESNHDLKVLESRLRAAYVAKGLAAQLKEHEAIQLQDKLRLQNEQEELERIRLVNEETSRAEWLKEEQRKKELREILKEQIVTSSLRNRQLYQDFLKEKRFLDEIAKRLQDENLELMRQKMLKLERTQKDLEDFRRQKEIWKREQDIKNEEENQKILEYCMARDVQKAAEEEARKQAAQERDRKTDKMVAELSEVMDEEKKREAVLLELYEIERDERETEKLRDELERKFRMRIETRIALDTQRANIQLRRDIEADEERRFEEDQMKFMEERDKIEQLSDEKRRRKQMEYRKAIRELIAQRRVERAELMADMVKQQEQDMKEEQEREKLIEEERLKLLKEHATALIGYLPAEILKELGNTG